MTSRAFDMEAQQDFGRLSGDLNPLHLDPQAARRLLFGRAVVHGVHQVLWALEELLPRDQGPLELASLRADFGRPLAVGAPAALLPGPQGGLQGGPRGGQAQVAWEGQTHTALEYTLRPASPGHPAMPAAAPAADACRELDPAAASTAQGELDLCLEPALAARLFPRLCALLPASQLAALLALTRLVGMHCPGQNSIFSALDMSFPEPAQSGAAGAQPVLAYQADGFQPRFAQLWLAVRGPGFQGRLKTFLRPAPRQQTSLERLAALVTPGEFAGARALVVGGSRGLGEVAAKLLAAGGASLRLTYRVGQAEASRLVKEIRAGGAQAQALAFDILEPPASLAADLGPGWRPNLLFYCATPPIFVARRMHFSPALFDQFCDYYLRGFQATLEAVLKTAEGGLKVLYPSSEAVDQLPPDMGEYAAAKAAGESLCAFLQKVNPRLTIMAPRFPRLPTDQTATLLPVASQDPDLLLLEWLRRLWRA